MIPLKARAFSHLLGRLRGWDAPQIADRVEALTESLASDPTLPHRIHLIGAR